MIRVKLLLLDKKARKIIGRKEAALKLPENKAVIRNLLDNIANGDEIIFY